MKEIKPRAKVFESLFFSPQIGFFFPTASNVRFDGKSKATIIVVWSILPTAKLDLQLKMMGSGPLLVVTRTIM